MKKFLQYILLTGICTLFLVPPVLAQGKLGDAVGRLQTTGDSAGVTETSVAVAVGTFINVALSLVGLIFLVLMVYAGYLWMIARGEEAQVEKAQGIIRAAVIGLVVVMSAYAITALITSRFG